MSTPNLDRNGRGKIAATIACPRSTTRRGDSSYVCKVPLEGPSQYMMVVNVRVLRTELWVLFLSLSLSLSLSRWRKVGLPLVLWHESGPNFR